MGLSLTNRLRRLEALSHGGPCPCCLDWARPVLLRGADAEPPSCPACGCRPAVILLLRDPDFYANRRRLDEVNYAAV